MKAIFCLGLALLTLGCNREPTAGEGASAGYGSGVNAGGYGGTNQSAGPTGPDTGRPENQSYANTNEAAKPPQGTPRTPPPDRE